MKLEHFGMAEPGDCRLVFTASAEELAAALTKEQAAPDAPQDEEELLTAAVNRTILEGFDPLYRQLVQEQQLVPVTDPDFELLAVNNHVTVTYFEIGLNMRLSREANEYIRLVSSVGENRKLFNDANFEENRQKTTEKSRCRSKVLKMYDKSFEYRSKGKAVESNILRLETSYRRQNIPLSEFFNDAFVFRLVSQFFRDWHSLSFPHQIIAEKGTKGSQIEKARRIMEVGRDAYLTESRKDMEAGIITPKQYRCIREFVQRWDDYRKTLRFSLHGYGVEFKNELCRVLRAVSG